MPIYEHPRGIVAADGQLVGTQASDRGRARRVGQVQLSLGERDRLAGQRRIKGDRIVAWVGVGIGDRLAQARQAVVGIDHVRGRGDTSGELTRGEEEYS